MDASPPGSEIERELLRLRSLPAYEHGTSNLPGFDFAYTHPHSLADIYQHVYVDGGYRFPPVGSPPVILDCGANIGVSVVWFKQQFPDARVTAFEPDPVLVELLRQNVEAAGFTDVTIVEQAVWIRDEVLNFAREGSDGGRISDRDEAWQGRQWQPTQVSATRLKQWLSEPIDLLKLDVEGAEIDILADCADTLSQVENIIFEYHSLKAEPQRLGATLTILEDAGFRLWVRDEWFPAHPLVTDRTNVGFDLQLEVYAQRRR